MHKITGGIVYSTRYHDLEREIAKETKEERKARLDKEEKEHKQYKQPQLQRQRESRHQLIERRKEWDKEQQRKAERPKLKCGSSIMRTFGKHKKKTLICKHYDYVPSKSDKWTQIETKSSLKAWSIPLGVKTSVIDMKHKSKKLTPQQMYKEINRIASFKKGYNWLLSLAHRYKYNIQKIDELPIEIWIEITHIECNRRRKKAQNVISNNHQHIFKKSQGNAAPYVGFVKMISTPMGGQNKRY